MAANRYALHVVVPPRGGHARAVASLVVNGQCPYTAYLTDLQRSNSAAAAKVVQMLDKLAEAGEGHYLKDRTQMEDVGGGIYELKPGDQRLMLMRQGVTWIVLSADTKPKGQKKVQSEWIQQMHALRHDYLSNR